MLAKTRMDRGPLGQLLDDPRIRQAMHDGSTRYSACDIIAVLCECERPERLWNDLLAKHPGLADAVTLAAFDGVEMDALEFRKLFDAVIELGSLE